RLSTRAKEPSGLNRGSCTGSVPATHAHFPPMSSSAGRQSASFPFLRDIDVTHREGGSELALVVDPLTSTIGAQVLGVNLVSIEHSQCEELRRLLAQYGVLVFRNQNMTRDQQVEFASQFAPVHGHPVDEFLDNGVQTQVALVENSPDKPVQRDRPFHSD